MAALSLFVLIGLLITVQRQIQYNLYSHNTIIYLGFSLFTLSIFITYTVLVIHIIREPDVYTSNQILYVLLESAKQYMLISFPFVLICSAGLCISNISLIRHEGKRLVNVLSIILSVLLLGGEIFLLTFDYYVSGSLAQVRMHELIANLFAAVYLYFECMLIGTIIANIIAVRYVPEPDKDFLIILGCGLQKDGTPTPLLRGRIDRALAFYENQKALTGKHEVFQRKDMGGQSGRKGSICHDELSRIPKRRFCKEREYARPWHGRRNKMVVLAECSRAGIHQSSDRQESPAGHPLDLHGDHIHRSDTCGVSVNRSTRKKGCRSG